MSNVDHVVSIYGPPRLSFPATSLNIQQKSSFQVSAPQEAQDRFRSDRAEELFNELNRINDPEAMRSRIGNFVEMPEIPPAGKLSLYLVGARDHHHPLGAEITRREDALSALHGIATAHSDPAMQLAARELIDEINAQISMLRDQIREDAVSEIGDGESAA